MTKQRFRIGTESPDTGFERFADAWQRAEQGALSEAEVYLHFEDLAMLLAILTPCRLEILRALRQHGPLSVRALSRMLQRDYKNVHGDTKKLEEVDLLQRDESGKLSAPWDVIDAHLSLVA